MSYSNVRKGIDKIKNLKVPFFLGILVVWFLKLCMCFVMIFLSGQNQFIFPTSKAAFQRCSYKKVFWNNAINLQEKTHAEVWFQLYWTYWNNFIEITLWHGCSLVNLFYFFRTAFPKSTYEGLLLLRHFIINTANIFTNLKRWVLGTKIFGITVKVYLDF